MALSRLKGKFFARANSDASNQTTIESNEESARRLQQRFLSERFCEEFFQRQKLKLRRRDQNKIFLHRRKFQFLRLERKFGFLFRLFSGGDGFAKRAGMFAVESFRHGFCDGLCAKIVREHRRPRDGLQQRPMRAEHRHEREDEKNFANTDEHKIKLVKKFTKSKIKRRERKFYVSEIQTSVPLGSKSNSGIKSASAR